MRDRGMKRNMEGRCRDGKMYRDGKENLRDGHMAKGREGR